MSIGHECKVKCCSRRKFPFPFVRAIDDQYGLEEMCTSLLHDMNEYGVCVLDNFIGQEKGLQVLQEVKAMYTAGYFKVSLKLTKNFSDRQPVALCRMAN